MHDNVPYFREAPSSAKIRKKNDLKFKKETFWGQSKWFCWIHNEKDQTAHCERHRARTPNLVLVPNPAQDEPRSSVPQPKKQQTTGKIGPLQGKLPQVTQEGESEL